MAPGALVLAWLLVTSSTGGAEPLEDEINETVVCSDDLMQVLIPSSFFLRKEPPVSVVDLHLNDPACRGEEVGDDFVFSIRTNLSDCGTVMASDETHIMFINNIINNVSDIITRNYINITFVCRYPGNYLVQQPDAGDAGIRVDVRTITLNTEDGNFSVSMLLYRDEAFEDRWTTVPSLSLDEDVFIRVFMTPAHLMLRLERCWATPTSDPYSNVQYTFIRDSCPVPSADQTLSVMKNGRGSDSTFRIQMFKFVGSYKNVFLHCNVQICISGGTCEPSCSHGDGLLRTQRDVRLSHTVSYGPIRRLLDENQSSPSVPVETFVLGGLLGVLLLVSGVFGRLWLRSRRFYPTQEADVVLSNVLHLSEEGRGTGDRQTCPL